MLIICFIKVVFMINGKVIYIRLICWLLGERLSIDLFKLFILVVRLEVFIGMDYVYSFMNKIENK